MKKNKEVIRIKLNFFRNNSLRTGKTLIPLSITDCGPGESIYTICSLSKRYILSKRGMKNNNIRKPGFHENDYK
jgi:hypothetical protein